MDRPCRLFLVLTITTASLFAGEWKSIGPGVDYQEFTPKAPFTYHVSRVDLTSGKIRPIVSSETDRGLTVSGFASKREAIVAINGDYFDPQMMPIGPTSGPCGPWKSRSGTSTRKETVVALTANRADMLEPAEQGDLAPSWSDHSIAGWPVLVRNCKALSDELPGSAAFTRAPHARTAVGLSGDQKILFLVVVDGQKDGSAGVTLPDLAAFMQRELHVCEAVNLDGGGSSAMAVDRKLVTSPINGAERPVANHLGIVLAKNYGGCPDESRVKVASSKGSKPIPAVEWWKDLEEILGRRGTITGDVFKVTYPRSDLTVTIDGVTLAPQLALTSWVGFRKSGTKFVMMGDLVLTEPEVGAVMKRLRDGSLQKTSLHNHLLGATPATMCLHIAGRSSDPTALAHAVRQALDVTATPIAQPATSVSNSWSDAMRKSLDGVMRQSGKTNGVVLQYSIPRPETITEGKMTTPPALGVASSINLQPLDVSGRVAASGDLVLIASEVDKVVNQLTKDGIRVTAIHDHMLSEQPRLIFVHLWTVGDGLDVARSLRRALDATRSR